MSALQLGCEFEPQWHGQNDSNIKTISCNDLSQGRVEGVYPRYICTDNVIVGYYDYMLCYTKTQNIKQSDRTRI